MKRLVSAVAVAFIVLCSGAAAAQSPEAASVQGTATAAPPTLIRIDGQIKSAPGAARTDTVLLVIGLYEAQDSPTPLWIEQQVVAVDANGRYTVFAGATLPEGVPRQYFTSDAGRWVGVAVEGQAEQPRIMLLSAPYALKARDADTLAGRTAADFVMAEHLTESVKSTLKSEGVKSNQGGADSGPLTASTAGKIAKFADTVNTVVDSTIMESGGNIGVGTITPLARVDILDAATSPFYLRTTAATGPYIRFVTGSTSPKGYFGWTNTGTSSSGLGFLNAAGSTVNLLVSDSGNVGIGTLFPTAKLDVAGNINVSGNINAKYQDVAEWVETAEPLEPGTIVIVDPVEPDRVLPSARAYDTRVAGAVSRQPGLILGERGDTKAMVAQSGRVRVKVDATYGAIRPGDLLVTSPTPGYAMRSKPVNVGGHSLHRPGTLLGKALEALPKGKGEILVLLTLQ